jgi:hypothetical protein
MATTVHPATGIEYYTDGPLEGQSVALFVNVNASNGQINNPAGNWWPRPNGEPHDFNEEFYRIVPFEAAPFDPGLRVIDETASGRALKPATPKPPAGHPQGTYEETQVTKRRSMASLKGLAKGYCEGFNREIWERLPQDIWSIEKLTFAKNEIAKGNSLEQYVEAVQKDESLRVKLRAASFHNDARLAELYAKIEEAGEDGNIDDWPFSKMQDGGEGYTGWVNGIEE